MTENEAKELLDNLIGMIEDSQGNDYDTALSMSIEALEKQIPKKPIYIIEYPACPSCMKSFYFERNDRYCVACGQKIDWSE